MADLPGVRTLVTETDVWLSRDDLLAFFEAAADAKSMGAMGSFAYAVAAAALKELSPQGEG